MASVKQLRGASKSNNKDLKDRLHQDVSLKADKCLSNKINDAFINVMQNYVLLYEDISVTINSDESPIIVSESTIAKKLREISTSRSSGPDDISNWVLKNFCDILASSITDIINASFGTCKVPQIWKLANVVPLPKVPIVHDLQQELRPISLTSTLSKIAESVIIEEKLNQSC